MGVGCELGVSWRGLGAKGVGSGVWPSAGFTPAPLGGLQQDTAHSSPKASLNLQSPASSLFCVAQSWELEVGEGEGNLRKGLPGSYQPPTLSTGQELPLLS